MDNTTGPLVEEKTFLSDDIIINILSWLPVKKASQCQIVCKKWRDLTLSPDFVDLHFRHSLPMILVSNPMHYKDTIDFFLLDNWWELTAGKKLINHKFNVDFGDNPTYICSALFSHVGLAVYNSGGGSFILSNPMHPGNVRITLSKDICWSEIYGVFFHPLTKEYCSLWMIQESNEPLTSWSHPKWIKYKMLSLGFNPSMKTISNPFSHRVKRTDSSSLFIDNYIYWMLEPENDECEDRYDIMQFDIISEQFTVMSCPVLQDYTEFSSDNTDLLIIDGTLSFLLILPKKISIWRLEDHAQQVWTTANYTFTKKLYKGNGVPSAIAIVDGKLALFLNGRLIVCNLVDGTICDRKILSNDSASIQSHQMSLASLSNSITQLFISHEGEVFQIANEG